MNARKRQRKRVVLYALFVVMLMLTEACRQVGVSTAPDVTLHEVRGGAFRLRSQTAQPLLLAFLQTVPDTADTPSRSQAVYLQSMAHQYAPRGLRVAIVDASALALASPPSRDSVLNASYDWQLNIPLLLDRDADLAREIGVQEVPTTFLITADGHILHRWRGTTRPAVLALATEKLLGGPLAQTP
jgi:peroxiredoxin